MSYFEHAARMRELEKELPSELIDQIGANASLFESSFLPKATLEENGMLIGFDHEITGDGPFGLPRTSKGFTAKVFVAWRGGKYLLFEDCAVAGLTSDSKSQMEQYHTILGLTGDGLGAYDSAAIRWWTGPVNPDESEEALPGDIDAPHPLLRRIQAMLTEDRSEALRLLEIELEVLFSNPSPLLLLKKEALLRIIEIIE